MFDLSQPWNYWFLQANLKENTNSDMGLEDVDVEHPIFNESKKDWCINLAKYYREGIYRTSQIVDFDLEKMEIRTKRGSIYKLGNPLNNQQLKNLKYYFVQSNDGIDGV